MINNTSKLCKQIEEKDTKKGKKLKKRKTRNKMMKLKMATKKGPLRKGSQALMEIIQNRINSNTDQYLKRVNKKKIDKLYHNVEEQRRLRDINPELILNHGKYSKLCTY